MKKLLFTILLVVISLSGIAQASPIEPLLAEEMDRHSAEEMIPVVVIMNTRCDLTQLNRQADHFTTRAARRDFVVNELKQFAAASQYDLRKALAEMESHGMVTLSRDLWIANALSLNATKGAILDLAKRTDLKSIGFDKEYRWIPEDEASTTTPNLRDIAANVSQVNANAVWALGYTGEGVVVAVIDSGVNYNHVDLADHLWDGGEAFPHHGYDVFNNDDDPMDDHRHGTHCAGTVCGDGTAGSQTGMAPDATLMCIKCMGANGTGSTTALCDGIQWAIEHGCDLFSMSLGMNGAPAELCSLIRSTCDAALAAGVVGIIAAGNEGDNQGEYPVPINIGLPGSCPPPYLDPVQAENAGGLSCSICVGAVDYSDSPAYFTSHGPVNWADTDYGDYSYDPGFGLIRPDVCAPGVSINSLNYANNNGYLTLSGTSMATPCVAGCVALMLSKNHELTPAELCRILEETAEPLDTWKSNVTGFGRVDVLRAIESITEGPVSYEAYALNDLGGNNNHLLNPGESATIDLTLRNNSNLALDNVNVVVTTPNDEVTITDGTASFTHFNANQSVTLSNAFAFEMSDNIQGMEAIRFDCDVYLNNEVCNKFCFYVKVYDYYLEFKQITVVGDDDGDGYLEPGETGNLRIYVDNVGIDMAPQVMGLLSTDYALATLNETEKSYQSIEGGARKYAEFSVTISEDAPTSFVLPLHLELTDVNGRQTFMDFDFRNTCDLIFELTDSYGDGWNGNKLIVSFDDGSEPQTLTIESGSYKAYILKVGIEAEVTLTWQSGNYTSECAFMAYYQNGVMVYASSGTLSEGVLTVFNMDCQCKDAGWSEPTCNVIFELTDQYGDGWNGNKLVLSFNDGKPSRFLTIDFGASASYPLAIGIGVEVSLNWYSKEWPEECSFTVRYENGDVIYQGANLSTGFLTSFTAACESPYSLGDVNLDETVNIADVILLLRHNMSGNHLSDNVLSLADVNQDGKVNISDVIVLLRQVMSGE